MAKQQKKVYFSHLAETYNSETEKRCIEIIKAKLPDYEIVNPKVHRDELKQYLKEKPKGETDFRNKLVNECVALVFLSYKDRRISADCYEEIQTAFKKKADVYEIYLTSDTAFRIENISALNIRVLTEDETKMRVSGGS